MKKKSEQLFRRIITGSGIIGVVAAAAFAFFTKNLLYGIMALAGAAFAIFGFIVMIKAFDNFVYRRKGGVLVGLSLVKLLLVTGLIYLLSRHSLLAVLSFAAGLLTPIGGIMAEALCQMGKALFHGRT